MLARLQHLKFVRAVMRIVNQLMRVISQLIDVPVTDPDDARRRRLLNILLLCVVVFVLVGFLAVLAGLVPPPPNENVFYWGVPIGLFGAVLIFLLNRYWSGRAAALLFLLLLMVSVFADDLENVSYGRSLLAFALPVVMASVLLRPYVSFVMAGLISLLINIVGMGMFHGPNVLAVFILFLVAWVSWIAARSAERALMDLRVINRELDQRVAERVRGVQRRSIQLQTASEIARDATATLDVDKLLDETVRLVSERFGLYHAGVFLIDERGEYAVLRAASSKGGRRMIEREFKLAVGKERIIGHVAGSGEPLVVLDVGKDAAYLINPDLLDTRSEMALPLTSRGRVIGVLDVQSTQKNAFSEEDVAVLRTMADQLANAIESARLFGETQQQARDLRLLCETGRLLASSLETTEVLGQIAQRCTEVFDADLTLVRLIEDGSLAVRGSYFRDPAEREEVEGLLSAHPIRVGEGIAGRVAATGQPEIHRGEDVSRLTLSGYVAYLRAREWVLVPMRIGETVTGVLTLIRRSEKGPFLERDVALAQGIADQVAIAIENARLYEEARHRLQGLTTLNRASQVITSSLDVKDVLEQIVELAGSVVNSDHTSVILLDEKGKPVLGAGDFLGVPRVAQRIRSRGVTRHVLDSGQTVVVDTISDEGAVSPPLRRPDGGLIEANPDIVAAGIRSFAAVPIQAKGRVMGVLFVHSRQPHAFREQVPLLTTFANQAAVAIENARLFEVEREQRAQAEALREAGIIVSSALDLDEVLERLLEQVERIVPSDSSSVVLISDGKARIAHQRGYERFGVADAVARLTLEVQETPSLRRMVETGQPHIVPDTSADPDWAVLEATVHIRSWAGAPILVGGEVVGFFSLDKIEAGFYQQQHAELLASFTRQAAIAVENARLFEEAKEHVTSLQKTTRDLELIRQVSQVTSSSLDLTRILETTAEQMVAVFGVDHSGILLFDQAQTYGQVMAEYPPTGATGERYPVQGYLAAERIIADREPLVIEDAWSDPLMAAVREAMHKLDIRSMLIVPLIVKGEVVGSIGLDAVGRQRRFSADEVALAQTIANQVAIAIENARLFERAQRRWQEAETLYRAAQALATTLDLHQVFERILSELQQVVPYDSASVQLLRDGQLEIIGGHGFPNLDELLGISFDPSDEDSPNREVMRQRAPFIVEDAPAVYPVFREEPHAAAGIRAWLGVPLLFGDRLTGMLALDKREPGFYTSEHAHLASAFAAQAAIAIENARLFEAANQRVAELEAVRQASLHLTSSLELQPVLEAILEHTLRLVSANDAHVFLYDGERLTFGAALWAGDFQQEPYDEPRPHGLTYTVARSGERIVVPDAKDHPLFQDQQWDQWGGAIVGLPLHVGDRVHGVMNVAFAKPRAFSENELRVLELLADQAAIAIENARLYEETRQRAEEMTALHETTLDITAQLEMPRLLNAIIERASALLGATGGLVHLYDPAEGKLVVVTSHNLDKDYTGLTLEVGEGAAGMVLQMEEPLIVEDHHAWADRSPQVADAAARAMLAVPLKWRERVIGVLDIIDEVRAGTFDEQDLRLLMPFANQAAIAIQNARLFEEVRQRARQWEALTEVGQAIGSVLDLDEVLQLILEQLEQVIPYDTVSLWLREGEVMRIRAVRGFERAKPHLGLTIAFQDDALSWEMVSARRPLVIADAQQDERFRALADTEWVRSWLGVPLLSKGEVIGLVTINKKEPGLYTAETAELALAFGQQAAMAIENARLYEEAKRRAEEMTALYGTFLEIGAPTDLPDLLWAICDRAARLLGVDKGGLYLYDEPRGELELAVSYKLGRDYTGTRIKLGEGVAGRVVQTGQPITVDDYSRWEERALAYEEESFGAVIAVPLRWQERTIGVITLSEATGRRTFTPDDERLLGLFAQQAAVAIESARLYEEARRHVEELSALHTIDVAIASTLNLDEVLERVYEQVSTVMNVAAFHIALYDEKKDAFHVPIIVDQGERLPPQTLEGGLSGWVVRTREPLWIGDMEKERDTLPVEAIALGVPTRSLMVLPLIVRDKVVGAMSAQSYEPYAFDEGHRRLFSGIAGQVAIAVQNARLFEETNRRLAETRLLQEVVQATASTLDFDEVLARTIETLHETLGMDCLAFVLPDEQGTGLVMHPSSIGYPECASIRAPMDMSVCGRVYQSGEPQIIPDVREVPYYFEAEQGIRSELAVPVKVADRVIAVLNVESPALAAFDEDDLRLFSAVAAQLGVVLENARLFEETDRRLTETRLLQEVMQAAASTLDFDEVLARTIETLHRTVGIEYLGFALPDDSGAAMVTHPSMIGFTIPPEGYPHLPIDGSIIGRVYQTGEPLLVHDVKQVPCYFETAPETRSELAVPVRVGDQVIGVLNAESPQLGAFGEDDLRLLSAVAAQLGVVLENARLFEETNRRLTGTHLLQEVMQAAASTLDFDEVLTRTVETLRRTLRVEYLTFVLPDELGADLLVHPSWIGYSEDGMTTIPMDRSVCGRVYLSGEAQIIPDVREEPCYFEGASEIRSELAVPVKVADQVIAVLNVESTALAAFDEDDLRLFSAIASQLGVALENTRLFEETNRRLVETRLLQEVMLAAASTLDFDLVLERTVKALNRALSIGRLGFLLPDEGSGALVSHPSLTGFAGEVFQVPVEGTLVGQAYRTGQPVVVRDLTQWPAHPELDPEVCSMLAVPVWVGGRVVAVLYAESVHVGAFSEGELRLFTTIAGQLGVTLENARLYQRLETQTAELSRAYNELQEIDRLRAELVQNVSHELRTPLGLIKGYIELLAAGDLGSVPDSQQAALQIVRERIATLSRLINNLTMLQATPREALVLAPVSVVEVVQYALAEFRRLAEEAGIVFQVELPEGLPPVIGDRERLGAVFGHLVDNAIKFSPDGGQVSLRAWADREMIYVSISDTGVGIPSDHMSRIFERFYQVDGSTSRRFGGMGVGLALVWEIVEAHGGVVNVESEAGKGSTFTVALPRAGGINESGSEPLIQQSTGLPT